MERTVNVGTKEAERKPVALRSGDALGEVETVARMVGGMKVAEGEREAVEECERKVSVAATEAETLGQAVWETVGDRERTVSVAAGETETLDEADGGVEAVGEAEWVAVVEYEHTVSVARAEAETLGQALKEAVEDGVRTVSVAAGEALAGAGLALPRLLPVPRGAVALTEALGEAEAEAAALADGREVVAGERLAVEESDRRVMVARAEAETLGQAE